MSSWYLDINANNFYVLSTVALKGPKEHAVEFFNTYQWDMIRSIRVSYIPGIKFGVNLFTVPLRTEKLFHVLQKWADFHNADDSIYMDYMEPRVPAFSLGPKAYTQLFRFPNYRIFARDIATLGKLIPLLQFVNQEFEEEVFTKEILQELQRIVDFIQAPDEADKSNYKHSIPDFPTSYSITKPKLDSPLIEALSQGKRTTNGYELGDDEYRKLKRLLSSGADPQQYIRAMRPLCFAVLMRFDARVIALLLLYHADPIFFDNTRIVSPLDLALRIGNKQIVDIFFESLNFFTKPIKTTVQSISLTKEENSVKTDIVFKSDKQTALTTYLKTNPSQAETAAMVSFCRSTFVLRDDPDAHRLTDAVKGDIYSDNAIVEMIYHDNVVVGFLIFNLLTEENQIYWYCSLAYLDPAYRHTGIIGILSWRSAFALQMLYPESRVGVFLLAVHHASFRLVENQLHWPLYKSPHVESLMKRLLHKVAPNVRMTYEAEEGVCYIEDQIAVNARSSNLTTKDRFFYQDILGQANFESGHKAAPVFFYVGDYSFDWFSQLANALGIHAESHLQLLAQALKHLITECKLILSPALREGNSGHWKHTATLFWKNEAVNTRHQFGILRSKL